MSDWTDYEFGVVSGRFNVNDQKDRINMLGEKEFVKLEGDIQNLPQSLDWRDA